MVLPIVTPMKRTNAIRKVRLLLWKNHLLQRRHYIQTSVEILLPVLFFVFGAWLYGKITEFPVVNEEQQYTSIEIDSLNPSVEGNWLVYSPNNTNFETLMGHVAERLNIKAIGVSDPDEIQELSKDNKFIAGIEFHHPNNAKEVPKNLAYSLHFSSYLRFSSVCGKYNWDTDSLFKDYDFITMCPTENDGGSPSYSAEGFLAIQNAIANVFIDMTEAPNKNGTMPKIQVQRFPTPSLTQTVNIASLFGILVIASMYYTFNNIVRCVAIEKEKQLKEAMKIMGLASWMHYLSWFIRTILMFLITILLTTILLTQDWFFAKTAIFPNSRFDCVFILCIGYCACLITLAFLISAIFTRSKIAMIGANFIYLATTLSGFVPYDDLSNWLKFLICFLPNTAMSYAIQIIWRLESAGVGLNWSTAFQGLNVYDNLSIASIFGIFMVNMCLLFIITLYLENILPGAYGVAKPWYFPFTRDFWQGHKNDPKSEDLHPVNLDLNSDRPYFENEPKNQAIGIKIHNLTKKFTSDKAAVDNLSLNLYENQITTFLGQNGAGKTTAISMLTGMIKPTSGTAIINGYDIRSNMDSARSSIGFCPQHNILFDELTVREHILFYCCLKGLSNNAAESEAQKYMRLLDLGDKKNAMSSTLSEGMQRKLSVVIALCGQSKVVFLDEPTSGMDPGARRALWDILLAEKKSRTILLTTHFMDEADVLSDRIAIMVDGELKSVGSTFFLKKRFGSGYHLICAKGNSCNSELVTDLLREYISDIQVESENERELSYILPEESSNLFPTIFSELENNRSHLKLKGFGVSLTTLEEIFLEIGKSDSFCAPPSNGSNDTRISLGNDQHLLNGCNLLVNQAFATLRKQCICWWRSLPSFFWINCIAILYISLALFQFGSLFSSSKDLPSLDINFDKYKEPIVVLQTDPRYPEFNVDRSNVELHIVNDNMQTALLEIAYKSLREYNFQYIAGVSFEGDTAIAWFNNQATHSAPLALYFVHDTFVKRILGKEYSIEVSNAPLKQQRYDGPTIDGNDSYVSKQKFSQFSIYVMISLVLVSTFYITFYIKEKASNGRFLQYVSGMNVPIFWGVSILWDLLTNCITITIMVVMFALSQPDQSVSAILFLILFMYNFAMMPVICILTLIFTSPTKGSSILTAFNFILSIAYMLETKMRFMYKFVASILWLYPLCTLYDGFNIISYFISLGETANIFSWDKGIGKNLVCMFCTGIIAYGLLIAIEIGAFKPLKEFIFRIKKRTPPNDEQTPVDGDVLAEKERINQITPQMLKSETMIMQNVSKFYGKLCAVNKFSVSIKTGECFGLLGKNGAGKSSIFKMLTGETMITDGEVYTRGYNQKTQLSRIYQIIGYCPQFNALLTTLTCRETLEIFALIRGVPIKHVKNYAEECARNLDFIQHIDKKIKQLSGGNKRKLSASLAIIGSPSIIFLDEPTTGMDPATKRNLWNVINRLRNEGKSIVLTSHSMEECEALCTRITVMVNGHSKCLGSPQHLKNKFCKGFELQIKVKQDDSVNLDEVRNFVIESFDGAILREEFLGVLTYMVPVEKIVWSSVFGIMEDGKKRLKIEDYAINQSSLEQVVLMLVKDQKPEHIQGK